MATLKVTNIKNESFAGDQLYLKTDGTLGLGTTSPAFPNGSGLEIYNSSVPRLKFTNSTSGTAAGDGSQIYLSASDLCIDHKETGDIKFYTAGTTKATLDSNGNLGIGTSDPDHKLHIEDGTTPRLVVEDTTNNVQAQIGADNTEARIGTASNHPVSFRINDTEKLRLTADGDFGIGTGDGWARLVVHESSTDTSLTGHNYLASQSGMSVENGSSTTGAFTAYTARVKNASGTQQSGSVAFQSTASGYTPEVHLTQRTGSGSQVTRLRIDKDGVSHFAGDVKVLTGDIQMGNGRGINFSPTADGPTMSTETFDDYEEGTWTPNLEASSGTDSWTGAIVGSYTKIGNQVTARFSMRDYSGDLGNSAISLTGLPFATNFRQYHGDFGIYNINAPADTIGKMMYFPAGSTIYFYWEKDNANGPQFNGGELKSGTYIEGNCTYRVA